MGVALFVIATYVVANFIGYWVHRLLHHPRSGRAFRDHFFHHVILYPPDNYLSDEYREPPTGAEQGKYYVCALALLALPLLLLGLWWYIAAVIEAILVLKLNAYIHDSLHIRGHWLERFSWFIRLRAIHHTHHVRTDLNLGIFDFTADRIHGTLKK